MNYRIVLDSSADLTTVPGKYWSVPLKIITSDKEYIDDERLDVDGMIRDLSRYKGRSTTACPGVGDWYTAFGDAETVYCITITSGLSGSYNAACAAAEQYRQEHPGRRVVVIDSLSAGPGLTILLEKLQELLDAGCGADQVEAEMTRFRPAAGLVFALASLHNLAQNGRTSPAVAQLAGILGIRLVGRASDEGTLEPQAKVRGETRALQELMKRMEERGYTGGKVHIHHCQNPQAAAELQRLLRGKYHGARITIRPTRALCSFYAEEGGLLVGFEGGV